MGRLSGIRRFLRGLQKDFNIGDCNSIKNGFRIVVYTDLEANLSLSRIYYPFYGARGVFAKY